MIRNICDKVKNVIAINTKNCFNMCIELEFTYHCINIICGPIYENQRRNFIFVKNHTITNSLTVTYVYMILDFIQLIVYLLGYYYVCIESFTFNFRHNED